MGRVPEAIDGEESFALLQTSYRALTKDGGHVWIRDVVHVVRNEAGEVESGRLHV